MTSFPFANMLVNEDEVLDFFVNAIKWRNTHKDQSSDMARYVFDATHPQLRLSFPISAEVDRLRYEFSALEAPGSSLDDNQPNENYEDEVWVRLLGLVNKAKEKRTV